MKMSVVFVSVLSTDTNTTDIFIIDGHASALGNVNSAGADRITNFQDGIDKVKFADLSDSIAGNHNKVSWKVDASANTVTIYAGAIENATKILAVIEGFTGTFSAADFTGLGTSVTAVEATAPLDISTFTLVGDPNKADVLGETDPLNRGTSGKDLFLVDSNPGTYPTADLVFSFARMQGDMIRFTHDNAAAGSTDITLHTIMKDNSVNGTKELYVFKTQGQENSLLAVIRNVASDFDLANNDVWENATILPFFDNVVDGTGTEGSTLPSPGPNVGPIKLNIEQLHGSTEVERDLFLIDTTATEVGKSDVVTAFNREHGDMLRFSHDDEAVKAENATKKNLWTRFVDSNNDDNVNDLAIYETQGDANSVLAVLEDVGTEFALTNDDVWEDATIDTFVPEIS